VSFSPARSSLTWTRMRRAGRFGVNVLGRQHERFAQRATPPGGGPIRRPRLGAPARRCTPADGRPRLPRVRDRRRAPRRRPLDRRRTRRRPAHLAEQRPARLLRRRIRRPATAKVDRRRGRPMAAPIHRKGAPPRARQQLSRRTTRGRAGRDRCSSTEATVSIGGLAHIPPLPRTTRSSGQPPASDVAALLL
jgi:hypothetical protein